MAPALATARPSLRGRGGARGARLPTSRRPTTPRPAPRPRRCSTPAAPRPSAAAAAAADGGDAAAAPPPEPERKGLGAKIKGFFSGERFTREKLAAIGVAAVLSYGFVSNINAVTLLIAAWLGYAKSIGASPLAAGNWKGYLAAYAALYAVVGNGLRPLRFSLSVAISPVFDALIARVERTLKVRRAFALGIIVFLVNVCGTFAYLFLGLWVACTVTGTPLLP